MLIENKFLHERDRRESYGRKTRTVRTTTVPIFCFIIIIVVILLETTIDFYVFLYFLFLKRNKISQINISKFRNSKIPKIQQS